MHHTRFPVSTRSSAPGRRTGIRPGSSVCVALAAAVALVLLAGACSGTDIGEPTDGAQSDGASVASTETEGTSGEDTGPGEGEMADTPDEPAVTNGSDDAAGSEAPESAQRADETVAEGDDLSGTTVTLLTHDSFNVSPETLEAFTESTGIKVEQLASGDAGVLVAQACLTAGEPLGDVLFGIDNTFLQRGLDCGIFESYASPGLADVPDHFELDGEHRVTPIDFGDVCLNYWVDSFDGSPPPPSSLDDLIDPAYADMLAVQSPETSSPGLAFLLATIAHYGDGWEGYWAALRNNGVSVTAGWEDAYYGEFIAGGGDRPIVVSYASSPPAEVIYADPPVDEPPYRGSHGQLLPPDRVRGRACGRGQPRRRPGSDRLHAHPDLPERRPAQHVRVPGDQLSHPPRGIRGARPDRGEPAHPRSRRGRGSAQRLDRPMGRDRPALTSPA